MKYISWAHSEMQTLRWNQFYLLFRWTLIRSCRSLCWQDLSQNMINSEMDRFLSADYKESSSFHRLLYLLTESWRGVRVQQHWWCQIEQFIFTRPGSSGHIAHVHLTHRDTQPNASPFICTADSKKRKTPALFSTEGSHEKWSWTSSCNY